MTNHFAERVNQSLDALFDDSQPTVPMDCSAINSKGGKGKGGGGKSAGKKGSCRSCGKTGHWAKECPQRSSGKAGVECHNCHQTGHYARDCPRKAAGGSGSEGRPAPSKGTSFGAFAGNCNFCGNTGHREKDCRKKVAAGGGKGVRAVTWDLPKESEDDGGGRTSGGWPSRGRNSSLLRRRAFGLGRLARDAPRRLGQRHHSPLWLRDMGVGRFLGPAFRHGRTRR